MRLTLDTILLIQSRETSICVVFFPNLPSLLSPHVFIVALAQYTSKKTLIEFQNCSCCDDAEHGLLGYTMDIVR